MRGACLQANSEPMDLDGSVQKNLISAVRSARRWRGQPVHADTLAHWMSVLTCAETELPSEAMLSQETLTRLIADFRTELAFRERFHGSRDASGT